jgi:hypothetical protein
LLCACRIRTFLFRSKEITITFGRDHLLVPTRRTEKKRPPNGREPRVTTYRDNAVILTLRVCEPCDDRCHDRCKLCSQKSLVRFVSQNQTKHDVSSRTAR